MSTKTPAIATATHRVHSPRGTPAGGIMAPPRLLLVDDEPAILEALGKFLRVRGYEIETALGGRAALELVQRGPQFKVMLCDVRMPGMTGIELVPQVLALDPDLAILMLTGMNDAPTATSVLSSGAMDYLLKPVELPDLERAIERALHKRALLIDRQHVERIIREEVATRTSELKQEQEALRHLSVSIVETLIIAMEAKDIYLRGHSQRIAELGASIAAELGLSEDTIEHVRMAGRIHDVGKIGIRESVLNKPGALTTEEYDHVKEHVRIGMEILHPLKHIGAALDYVQDHHEHWDGTGYPNGKAATDIAIGGRILAAADAYDSITSHRAYRKPLTPRETVAYLRDHTGSLLDPEVFGALANVIVRQKSLVFSFIEDT